MGSCARRRNILHTIPLLVVPVGLKWLQASWRRVQSSRCSSPFVPTAGECVCPIWDFRHTRSAVRRGHGKVEEVLSTDTMLLCSSCWRFVHIGLFQISVHGICMATASVPSCEGMPVWGSRSVHDNIIRPVASNRKQIPWIGTKLVEGLSARIPSSFEGIKLRRIAAPGAYWRCWEPYSIKRRWC